MSQLMRDKQGVVDALLQDQMCQPTEQTVSAFASTNIALCKYWGKRDQVLHLPCNSSVSLSLPDHGCTTNLSVLDAAEDEVWLNGERIEVDARFYQKLVAYLDLFRGNQQHHYRVKTDSNIPIAAGLASSACGFAAIVLALRQLYQWTLSDKDCSMLARLGSGSASRSLWPGFVAWQRGHSVDGMDSYAYPLEQAWPEFCMAVLMVDEQQKPISSREGMQCTVETSSLFAAWPEKAETDFVAIKRAVLDRDFFTVASLAENNALFMHATMHAAKPPINYWQTASIAAMQKVWQLRRDGLAVYLTMDAGPNIKLIYRTKDADAVKQNFPEMIVVS